jgi:cold shock protein
MASDRIRGTIRRLVNEKGFGFIEDDKGTQYFFHRSAVQDAYFESLTVGSKVEFSSKTGLKGPRAEQVRVVS